MKNTSVVVFTYFLIFSHLWGWKITTQLTKDLCILYIMYVKTSNEVHVNVIG